MAEYTKQRNSRKSRREIRRRMCNYGRVSCDTLERDLRVASEKENVCDVVLISMALAKSNNTKDLAAESLGNILWKLRDGENTPINWALKAAAKNVVKFIVAWYIMCSLMNSECVDTNGSFHHDQKRSLANWLHLVGDHGLVGDNESSREALANYSSLKNSRFTFHELVSRLIAPSIAGHSLLERYVTRALSEIGQPGNMRPCLHILEVDEDSDFDDFYFVNDNDDSINSCDWEMVSTVTSIDSF